MIYTLTLNPALDYDIYLDKLTSGKLNKTKSTNIRVGGKGINVSLMLHNLGVKNIALGFIGGFTGDFIKEELNKIGIENMFISIKENTRINIKINDDFNETEISGTSPSFTNNDLVKILDIVEKFDENDILVMSGSIPEGFPKDIYKRIAKNTNASTILDTRGEDLINNIYMNILVKPNIKELEEVFNTKIENIEDIVKYARKLIDLGCKYVLVSQGSEGATLVTKNNFYNLHSPKGEYINSIGAGDSTVAGFIYSYINDLNDTEILKLCIACGSATAYSYGIGSKELVKELLK